MIKRLKTYLLLIGIVISFQAEAQIVNVESLRLKEDSTGFVGSFGGSFDLEKNVDQIFSAEAFATIQYKKKKNTWLLLGDYSFLKGAEKNLLNEIFGHFRYDRKITNFFRMEAFTQLQTNKVTKIDRRFLVGLGPRINLLSDSTLKIYLGILFMYEYEKELLTPVIYHRVIRNSSYLTVTFKPNKHIKIVSTTFYQPLADQLRDFRILNQESFIFTITKKLSLIIDWNYLYDASPVLGIPKSNYSLSTGLKYIFNP